MKTIQDSLLDMATEVFGACEIVTDANGIEATVTVVGTSQGKRFRWFEQRYSRLFLQQTEGLALLMVKADMMSMLPKTMADFRELGAIARRIAGRK